MIHQMELYVGYTEKCRRVELLKHFEPGEHLKLHMKMLLK